jgi:hypothetical protein
VRKPAIRPTRAIGASCRAGAASGHATAPQPSSVLNSRRFVANSVPGVLNPSVGIFQHGSKRTDVRTGSIASL